MTKVAILTDSNSGITQKQAEELGLYVIPMPFFINDETYYENINLTVSQFYQMLSEDANITTSQPAPQTMLDTWDSILKDYDEIVYIPMSSGLSGSCGTATMLSEDYEGKVQVVNNQRISVTQRQSVLDAKKLADNGKNATEIKDILEKAKLESSIYIMVDTLKYLKKGGRITPAAAALGTLLRLKPVLQIQGEKLDAFAKARTVSQAKDIMSEAMKKDVETRFGGNDPANLDIYIAHTENEAAAIAFREELLQIFPGFDIYIDHLSLSVSCHIGPGSLAVACSKKIELCM